MLALEGVSNAGTYYVSPSGTASWSQCTNINTSCSATTAMTNAVAGDTVYFRGGQYEVGFCNAAPCLSPSHSGTSGNPITFAAYLGETPVINGDATGHDNSYVIGSYNHDYIIWDGFTLQANDGVYMGSAILSTAHYCIIRNCTFNGGTRLIPTNDNRPIIRLELGGNNKVQMCKLYGGKSDHDVEDVGGIQWYHDLNDIIENNEIYNTTAAINMKSEATGAMIRYNWIHDVVRGIWGNASVSVMSSNNVTVHDNVVANATWCGINIFPNKLNPPEVQPTVNDLIIYNNTVYNTYRGIAAPYGSVGHGSTIYNNIVTGINYKEFNIQAYFDSVSLVELDYNQWGAGTLSMYNGSTGPYTTLSAWRATTIIDGNNHPDTHSLASDPKFVNGSGNLNQLTDFNLAVNSPCKGTGKGGIDMGANIDLVGVGNSTGQERPAHPKNLQ